MCKTHFRWYPLSRKFQVIKLLSNFFHRLFEIVSIGCTNCYTFDLTAFSFFENTHKIISYGCSLSIPSLKTNRVIAVYFRTLLVHFCPTQRDLEFSFTTVAGFFDQCLSSKFPKPYKRFCRPIWIE